MKVDNPPSAENWSRMQHPEVAATSNDIFKFLKGRPQFTYEAFRRTTRYRIHDRIVLEHALRINSEFGSELGRKHNEDAIRAFFQFEESHPIEGLPIFAEVIEHYPLSRDCRIPIKPVSVIREDGRFVPVFVIPWTQWAFDDFQASLYLTILDRSIFTLTDFEDSQAKILFLPRFGLNKDAPRTPVLWSRDQFPLLSDNDFADQIRVYWEGRDSAVQRYNDYLASRA